MNLYSKHLNLYLKHLNLYLKHLNPYLKYLLSTLSLFTLLISTAFASEQLIIEPDAGRTPLITAINHANTSVNLVMYGFTDKDLIDALIHAKKSGKTIQVLLEPNPYRAAGENNFAIKRLQKANISLQWPNPEFQLTHQKTFILDQKSAIVMTFNLTHSSFNNERNFAIMIDDPAMVQEITRVFAADWQHKTIRVSNPNLIWSPDNSRAKILNFIKEAHSSIQIYAQDISDYQTIGTLAKAARAGKKVEILLSTPTRKRNNKLDYLRRAGVTIQFSNQYIIHAKVIIADHERAILGSINLTAPSMNDNRELSIITHDKKVIDDLEKTFAKDWHA